MNTYLILYTVNGQCGRKQDWQSAYNENQAKSVFRDKMKRSGSSDIVIISAKLQS